MSKKTIKELCWLTLVAVLFVVGFKMVDWIVSYILVNYFG